MNILQRTWSELVPHVPEDGFAGTQIDMPGVLELLLSCYPCSLTAGVSQPRPLPVQGAALWNGRLNERGDLGDDARTREACDNGVEMSNSNCSAQRRCRGKVVREEKRGYKEERLYFGSRSRRSQAIARSRVVVLEHSEGHLEASVDLARQAQCKQAGQQRLDLWAAMLPN